MCPIATISLYFCHITLNKPLEHKLVRLLLLEENKTKKMLPEELHQFDSSSVGFKSLSLMVVTSPLSDPSKGRVLELILTTVISNMVITHPNPKTAFWSCEDGPKGPHNAGFKLKLSLIKIAAQTPKPIFSNCCWWCKSDAFAGWPPLYCECSNT